MAMMAITTRSSISVKAPRRWKENVFITADLANAELCKVKTSFEPSSHIHWQLAKPKEYGSG
jgi:hypothetical protein